MMSGCYILHLYCDNKEATDHIYDEFPHEYTHELGCTCRETARKRGWIITKDKQICPKCSGKKPWSRIAQ